MQPTADASVIPVEHVVDAGLPWPATSLAVIFVFVFSPLKNCMGTGTRDFAKSKLLLIIIII